MDDKEYVERTALIKFAMNHIPNICGDTTMKSVKRALKAAPAETDVVEVVRCVNCKHLMFSDCYGECLLRGGIVSPDDYCSRGERKG